MKVRILSLITILTLLTGCPAHIPYIYFGESIEAWLVDEDTGKPLEGVVVIAEWELYASMFVEYKRVGQLKLMETITDKNGRFYFPFWGPKTTVVGHLKENSPGLTFFKSGYKWTGRPKLFKKNQYDYDWNGNVFQLSKFKGSMEEYAKHLSRFRYLSYGLRSNSNSECNWKKIPYTIVAFHKQKAIFDKYNLYSRLYSIEGLEKMSSKSCGSPQSFFRSYIQ